MYNNLLFDFSVNKENKIIHVKREFNANLEKTIEMGFKEGFTMGLNQLDELLLALKK